MKKRILFINGHVNVGGVEKALIDLLCHIDYEKYEVDLLLLEDEGDFFDEIPDCVHVIFKDLTNTYGSIIDSLNVSLKEKDWLCFYMRIIFFSEKVFGKKILRLARHVLLGKKNYDCAIGFRPGLCSDIVAHAIKAHQKITWWHHGELGMDKIQCHEYEKVCIFFDQVITVSAGSAEMLEKCIPSISNKLMVIPNIVDVHAVRAKADIFEPYGQKSIFRIVSVCRISPEKHVENAVYVAEQLINEGVTEFIWHIVGDGAERANIEKLIREKKLEHLFSWEGSQTNPYPYMKHADLYVHTSYVESLGLTILEAMALGIPCVVTRSLGAEDLIYDGDNGILVEQNVASLTSAVIGLIRSPEKLADLRAKTCCPARFSPDNILRKIEISIGI